MKATTFVFSIGTLIVLAATPSAAGEFIIANPSASGMGVGLAFGLVAMLFS